MLVQGVWGYRVAAFPAWRYRRTPLVILHLAGACVFGLAWLKPVFPISASAIVVMGLYTGYAYCNAVYYSSNSGRRSFNIGVNECLVGMGSFAGLFAAQWGEMRIGANGGMLCRVRHCPAGVAFDPGRRYFLATLIGLAELAVPAPLGLSATVGRLNRHSLGYATRPKNGPWRHG